MTSVAFTRVSEEFAQQLSAYPAGTGGALAVYLGEDLAVDQWGGESSPGVPWVSDTMAVTFSASKGVSAATLLSLAERTGLDIDKPLGDYWPAFRASGKESITVGEMLSHQAGLPYWADYPQVVTAESPVSTWLREDEITASLASSPTVPGARGQFVYHAVTLGWLMHGLVRSLTDASLSEMFASTFASPNRLEYHLGLPPDLSDRVATLIASPALEVDPADPDPERSAKALLRSPDGVDYLHNLDLINSRAFHAVPQGACNGIGTARGLAGVYVALAALRADRMSTRFTRRVLTITAPGPRREQGLGFQVQMPTPWNDANTAFGHTGAGGGIGFYDPQQRLAFAFVTNHMNFGNDQRVERLRAAVAADLAAAE